MAQRPALLRSEIQYRDKDRASVNTQSPDGLRATCPKRTHDDTSSPHYAAGAALHLDDGTSSDDWNHGKRRHIESIAASPLGLNALVPMLQSQPLQASSRNCYSHGNRNPSGEPQLISSLGQQQMGIGLAGPHGSTTQTGPPATTTTTAAAGVQGAVAQSPLPQAATAPAAATARDVQSLHLGHRYGGAVRGASLALPDGVEGGGNDAAPPTATAAPAAATPVPMPADRPFAAALIPAMLNLHQPLHAHPVPPLTAGPCQQLPCISAATAAATSPPQDGPGLEQSPGQQLQQQQQATACTAGLMLLLQPQPQVEVEEQLQRGLQLQQQQQQLVIAQQLQQVAQQQQQPQEPGRILDDGHELDLDSDLDQDEDEQRSMNPHQGQQQQQQQEQHQQPQHDPGYQQQQQSQLLHQQFCTGGSVRAATAAVAEAAAASTEDAAAEANNAVPPAAGKVSGGGGGDGGRGGVAAAVVVPTAGWAEPVRQLYTMLDYMALQEAAGSGRLTTITVNWVNRPSSLIHYGVEVFTVPVNCTVGYLKRLICKASGGALWPRALRAMGHHGQVPKQDGDVDANPAPAASVTVSASAAHDGCLAASGGGLQHGRGPAFPDSGGRSSEPLLQAPPPLLQDLDLDDTLQRYAAAGDGGAAGGDGGGDASIAGDTGTASGASFGLSLEDPGCAGTIDSAGHRPPPPPPPQQQGPYNACTGVQASTADEAAALCGSAVVDTDVLGDAGGEVKVGVPPSASPPAKRASQVPPQPSPRLVEGHGGGGGGDNGGSGGDRGAGGGGSASGSADGGAANDLRTLADIGILPGSLVSMEADALILPLHHQLFMALQQTQAMTATAGAAAAAATGDPSPLQAGLCSNTAAFDQAYAAAATAAAVAAAAGGSGAGSTQIGGSGDGNGGMGRGSRRERGGGDGKHGKGGAGGPLKERFTIEEMLALVSGIEELGLKWALIQKSRPELRNKKQGDLKDKWRNWQRNVAVSWMTSRVALPDQLRDRINALVVAAQRGELAAHAAAPAAAAVAAAAAGHASSLQAQQQRAGAGSGSGGSLQLQQQQRSGVEALSMQASAAAAASAAGQPAVAAADVGKVSTLLGPAPAETLNRPEDRREEQQGSLHYHHHHDLNQQQLQQQEHVPGSAPHAQHAQQQQLLLRLLPAARAGGEAVDGGPAANEQHVASSPRKQEDMAELAAGGVLPGEQQCHQLQQHQHGDAALLEEAQNRQQLLQLQAAHAAQAAKAAQEAQAQAQAQLAAAAAAVAAAAAAGQVEGDAAGGLGLLAGLQLGPHPHAHGAGLGAPALSLSLSLALPPVEDLTRLAQPPPTLQAAVAAAAASAPSAAGLTGSGPSGGASTPVRRCEVAGGPGGVMATAEGGQVQVQLQPHYHPAVHQGFPLDMAALMDGAPDPSAALVSHLGLSMGPLGPLGPSGVLHLGGGSATDQSAAAAHMAHGLPITTHGSVMLGLAMDTATGQHLRPPQPQQPSLAVGPLSALGPDDLGTLEDTEQQQHQRLAVAVAAVAAAAAAGAHPHMLHSLQPLQRLQLLQPTVQQPVHAQMRLPQPNSSALTAAAMQSPLQQLQMPLQQQQQLLLLQPAPMRMQ